MGKIRSFVSAAVALTLVSAVPVAAPVAAQPVVFQFGCRADNGFSVWSGAYAWGEGTGTNISTACHYAKLNCAQNSQVGTVCYARTWWQNW